MKCLFSVVQTENNFYRMGKYRRIMVRHDILSNEKTSGLFTTETMGALDNYAKHNNLLIYLRTNKLGDIVRTAVYKGRKLSPKTFIMSTKGAQENFPEFLRKLYINVENALKKSQ